MCHEALDLALEGLKFYSEGKHFRTSYMVEDDSIITNVIDRGEKAKEIINLITTQKNPTGD